MSNNKNYFEGKFGFKKNPKVEKAKDARFEKRIQKEFESPRQDKWEHQDKFDASRKSKPSGDRKFGDKKYDGEKKFGDRKFSDRKFDGDRKFGDKKFDGEKKFGDRKFGDKKFDGERKFSDRKFDGDRKFGDKKFDGEKKFGDRKFGDKKFDGERKFSDRKFDGDRKFGDKKFDGEKKFGDRKFGDKKFDGERKFSDRKFDGDRKFGEEKKYGDKKFDKGGVEKKGFGKKSFDNKDGEKPKKFGAQIFAKDKREKEIFYTEEDRTRLFGEEAFKDRVLKELEEEIDNDLDLDKKKKAFKKKEDRRNTREARKGSEDYEFTKYIDDESDFEIAYEAAGGRKWEVEKAMDQSYKKPVGEEEEMPLNKYIAYCGICSRRDAVSVIKSGKVSVDGEVCKEPGRKVLKTADITVDGKRVAIQKNIVYILMNKPKGFITTTDDPKGRRTVMDLVSNHIEERVFPVGRLDRNTTGLLLLTNDGDLAQQLAHPKYEIRKIYHVVLDKNLAKPDFDKIIKGVELEDGIAPVDHLAYLESKNEIGIEIHSGKNRIVRRIFESCGYVVEKLDRVMYAGLTKKNIPRGKWRLLNKQEIINLKHLGKK